MMINKNDKILGKEGKSESERKSESEKKGSKPLAIVLAGLIAVETIFGGCAINKAQEKQERCTNSAECELVSIECKLKEIEDKINDFEDKINDLGKRIKEGQKRIKNLDDNTTAAVIGWYRNGLCDSFDRYIKELGNKGASEKYIVKLKYYALVNYGCNLYGSSNQSTKSK